ncbi:30S ribosomal protein S12 methylthiotransferase RimO [bacterium]
MLKVSVIALGCNKNEIDCESLIGCLLPYVCITSDLKQADVIIISPCAFLKSARNEALKYIKSLVEYKKKYSCRCIVVTGCYTSLLKEGILDKIKEVDIAVSIGSMESMYSIIDDFLNSKNNNRFFYEDFDVRKNYARPVTGFFSTYLKISDGCNNKCSYCLIPKIRGRYISRPKKDILQEAKVLAQNGVRELNILGQDIGLYGTDTRSSLYSLLKDLTKIEELKWIRLLYMHPRHIDENIVSLIANEEKICKYIDIPIQHINDRILKLMNRKITKNEIYKKLDFLIKKIPNITLRTTFIIGFPSETRKEFQEILSFIKDYQFHRLGAFAFSREKGTKAFDIRGQVPYKIKIQRKNELLNQQKKISKKLNETCLNRSIEVLVEETLNKRNTEFRGRSENMSPSVDGNVFFQTNEKCRPGDFVNIDIKSVSAYDMYGIYN